eukprot:m.247770 g.247770  ORF g.247770 m.247770 type:complete len:395 (+) comp15493_c0_seq1:173-1357(+)
MLRTLLPALAHCARRHVPLLASTVRQRHAAGRLFALPIVFAAGAVAADGAKRFPPTAADISKIMLPDDANPAGNVHGGTILHLVDQAGFLAATRYCNQGAPEEPLVASLARIEQCEFHAPMHIGELAQVHAEVTFVAKHSLEVIVHVVAVNPLTGKSRKTNTARAWYVAKPISKLQQPAVHSAALPPMNYASATEEQAGYNRYVHQKKLRQSNEEAEAVVKACASVRTDMMRLHLRPEEKVEHAVGASASSLVHLTLPSDCAAGGIVQAGVIMKLMDNVAGIVAARHCRKNIVTASLDSMDFHHPVHNANVVSLYAWPTFTSARSIEIEVAVFAEDIRSEQQVLCNSSRFTFVSLDPQGKVATLPALVVTTDEEKARFQSGQSRYEARKQARTR